MPQDFLQKVFKPACKQKCEVIETTPTQYEKQRRVLAYGLQNGSITIFEAVSECADYAFGKTITRLRRKGYISHSVWEQNASGRGRHKRHFFKQLKKEK